MIFLKKRGNRLVTLYFSFSTACLMQGVDQIRICKPDQGCYVYLSGIFLNTWGDFYHARFA